MSTRGGDLDADVEVSLLRNARCGNNTLVLLCESSYTCSEL